MLLAGRMDGSAGLIARNWLMWDGWKRRSHFNSFRRQGLRETRGDGGILEACRPYICKEDRLSCAAISCFRGWLFCVGAKTELVGSGLAQAAVETRQSDGALAMFREISVLKAPRLLQVLGRYRQETHRFAADLDIDEAKALEGQVYRAAGLNLRRLVEHDRYQPFLEIGPGVVS